MRRPLFLSALLGVLCFANPAAHADSIVNFALSGDAPADMGVGQPTGSVMIDTTLGTVLSVNFTTTSNPFTTFTGSFWGADPSGLYDLSSDWASRPDGGGSLIQVGVVLPVGSLVGYGGGPICSVAYACALGESSDLFVGIRSFNLLDGELTVATPEPSGLILLGTGLLGLVGVSRRRFADA